MTRDHRQEAPLPVKNDNSLKITFPAQVLLDIKERDGLP